MKALIIITIFSILLYSCNEEEFPDKDPNVNDKLVEEYTYDPYGVVFKIKNDINNAFNLNFDSLAFSKFQYDYFNVTVDDLNKIEYFTWIPYDHYVNWRYNYTGKKFVTIITNISEEGFIINSAIKTYSCNPSEISEEWFQEVFPYPVDDTVYVNISDIIDDILTLKYN